MILLNTAIYNSKFIYFGFQLCINIGSQKLSQQFHQTNGPIAKKIKFLYKSYILANNSGGVQYKTLVDFFLAFSKSFEQEFWAALEWQVHLVCMCLRPIPYALPALDVNLFYIVINTSGNVISGGGDFCHYFELSGRRVWDGK